MHSRATRRRRQAHPNGARLHRGGALAVAAAVCLLAPAAASAAVKVDAGNAHTCAVKATGGVACWGKNTSGQTDVPPELG